MALNLIWVALVVGSVVLGFFKLASGDATVLVRMQGALFDAARQGFDLSIGLVGLMSFWLGIMKIGERAGMIALFARAIDPLLRQLMPQIPPRHPAMGGMAMNLGANMLGLDNAATPLGLQAMRELQSLNPIKDTASDPMIMFMVLNTAGLTLIPSSVMAIRQSMALEQGLIGFNAADILVPTLLATFISWSAGLIAVASFQGISLWRRPFIGLLGGFAALVGGLVWASQHIGTNALQSHIGTIGSMMLLGIITSFVAIGALRRVPVYSAFIDGAKEGFNVAIGIVPYLVAMLAAIALFRSVGAMDTLLSSLQYSAARLGLDTQFVPAVPVGLMKILSGHGARGLMIDVMQTHGVTSFAGRLAAIIQGSTETTLYVLAVYFGSVGIHKTRYALTCALIADMVGLVGAILVTYAFYSFS
jgi:spore maturation protein SpmA